MLLGLIAATVLLGHDGVNARSPDRPLIKRNTRTTIRIIRDCYTARGQARRRAGATQERALEAVRCSAWFGENGLAAAAVLKPTVA